MKATMDSVLQILLAQHLWLPNLLPPEEEQSTLDLAEQGPFKALYLKEGIS